MLLKILAQFPNFLNRTEEKNQQPIGESWNPSADRQSQELSSSGIEDHPL
jgi:hypothetical protein